MRNTRNDQVIGIPIGSMAFAAEQLAETCGSSQLPRDRKDSFTNWMSRFSKRAKHYAQIIHEYVKLGPKNSKSKRILQPGVAERVFKQNVSVNQSEKLVKAMQCSLSTTSGPISGMLFISTEKIAFCSEKSFKITSSSGDNVAEVPYKVLIPLHRIKRVNRSKSMEKPSDKYVQVVTFDNFDFWFMGIGSHQKCLKNLQVRKVKCGSEMLFL